MLDEVIKIKIGDSKYSQVFNGVGMDYGRFTGFIIRNQHIGLLGEHNFSFIKLAVKKPCIVLTPLSSRLSNELISGEHIRAVIITIKFDNQ
jgi:hypothetical protein